ncbi:MAG: S-layer homology domain-containing protein, partial [Chloroflexota bacterium]
YNQLSGAIPPELGNLAQLQGLFLSNNQLSGAIPPELGNLTQLQYLSLKFNQLSGDIPTTITNLTQLAILSFDCWLTSPNATVTAFILSIDPGWKNCPLVQAITCASANPTSAASVDFTVTFSENVTGVDAGDFDVTVGGHLLWANVIAVNGSGSSYTVTVSTGKGDGTLRLDVPVTAAITDLAGNPLGGLPFTVGHGYMVSRPVTFSDVPGTYWAWQHIERLYNAGITGGCTSTPLNYCPETAVTRAQMAVFLLVAKHGAGYTPPAATGLFSDVPASNGFAPWIEQMAAEGITGGCGGGKFCPNDAVTREQMAVFLLVAEHGAGYNPPAAVGMFSDIPTGNPFAKWIEQLANEGITGGCGGGKFCPKTPVTRAQMAVFLVAAFNLP